MQSTTLRGSFFTYNVNRCRMLLFVVSLLSNPSLLSAEFSSTSLKPHPCQIPNFTWQASDIISRTPDISAWQQCQKICRESPNCSSITLTLPTFPIFPNFCVAFTTTSNTSSKLVDSSINSPIKRNNQDTSQSFLSFYSRPSLPCSSCVSGSHLIFVGFHFFHTRKNLTPQSQAKEQNFRSSKSLSTYYFCFYLSQFLATFSSAFQGKTTNIRRDQALLFAFAQLQENAWQAVLTRLLSRKNLFLHFENPANACVES